MIFDEGFALKLPPGTYPRTPFCITDSSHSHFIKADELVNRYYENMLDKESEKVNHE